MPYTFESVFIFEIHSEAEYHAKISGTYYPGYKGDEIDPPEGASFEISKVEILVGKDWRELPDWLISEKQSEALSEAGLDAIDEDREYHRERAAEMRREEAREDARSLININLAAE
jgi:hypothetical protein